MNQKLLILYGAGSVGKDLCEKLHRLGIPVECLCDGNPQKWGTTISGVVVKSIDEVNAQYKKGEYAMFVSIMPDNDVSVKNELIGRGLFTPSDFCEDGIDQLIVKRFPGNTGKNKEKRARYVAAVEKNFIRLGSEKDSRLSTLVKGLFGEECVQTQLGKSYFFKSLYGSLGRYRNEMIPWLESIHPLKNAKILEIGCGTGVLTCALCEQGADVTAIDINEQYLDACKKRLEIYGLRAQIDFFNAADIKQRFSGGFDYIIYAATLEHMTYAERLTTIKAAYDMLGSNHQYIVVSNTPNRLWHTDTHTSLEPFYHWLPDNMAVDYAKLTRREDFKNLFDGTEESPVTLARWGRGVSYHEFEIAAGRGNLEVISSMKDFLDKPDDLFKTFLKMKGPRHISDGFYEENLDIALQRLKL